MFVRKLEFCSDGSTALAQTESHTFDFISVPTLQTNRTFPQPAPILTSAWYPHATTQDPATFCFLASVRECPVKLLDAADGRLRASYPIVDHRERQIAPHALAFNLSADKIYCGFEDAIEVFDVHRPGAGMGTRHPTTPSRASRDGLKGPISALAFSRSPGYYAAGTLTGAGIALFNEDGKAPVGFVSVGDGVGSSTEGVGVGAGLGRAGVSQLAFDPARPHILYAAFRRCDSIFAWDLRGDPFAPLAALSVASVPSTTTAEPRTSELTESTPKPHTNQRMYFDVHAEGKWLASGTRGGDIALFDLENPVGEVQPTRLWHGHGDAVGTVAFHPTSMLLSASGSRHFADPSTWSSSSSSSSDSDSDADDELDGETSEKLHIHKIKTSPEPKRKPRTIHWHQPTALDASLKLWDLDGREVHSLPSTTA